MKLFDMLSNLDKIYKDSKIDFSIKPEIQKSEVKTYTTIKEYKRQYYLKNLAIYKERNRLYRETKKAERIAKLL